MGTLPPPAVGMAAPPPPSVSMSAPPPPSVGMSAPPPPIVSMAAPTQLQTPSSLPIESTTISSHFFTNNPPPPMVSTQPQQIIFATTTTSMTSQLPPPPPVVSQMPSVVGLFRPEVSIAPTRLQITPVTSAATEASKSPVLLDRYGMPLPVPKRTRVESPIVLPKSSDGLAPASISSITPQQLVDRLRADIRQPNAGVVVRPPIPAPPILRGDALRHRIPSASMFPPPSVAAPPPPPMVSDPINLNRPPPPAARAQSMPFQPVMFLQ